MPFLVDLADKIKAWANNKFQPMLINQSNIKSINNESLLGEGNLQIDSGGGESVNIETLSVDKTLTTSDATIQMLSCSSNRTINLPTTGLNPGHKYVIWNVNSVSSTYYLIVKQSTTTIYHVVSKNSIELRWNGTNWIANYYSNLALGSNTFGNYSDGIGIGGSSYSNYTGGIGIGYNANTNNNYGIGIGYGANNNSNYGVGIGNGATNNLNYALSIGHNATANSKQHNTIALGAFSKAERNREFVITASQSTTNKSLFVIQRFIEKDLTSNSQSWQELFIDGSSARLLLLAKSIYQFKIQINAMDTINFYSKTWEMTGCIKRDNSNYTALLGTPTKVLIGGDGSASSWDVQVLADDYNEALIVQVKHNSGNLVRFSMNIIATEIRI